MGFAAKAFAALVAIEAFDSFVMDKDVLSEQVATAKNNLIIK